MSPLYYMCSLGRYRSSAAGPTALGQGLRLGYQGGGHNARVTEQVAVEQFAVHWPPHHRFLFPAKNLISFNRWGFRKELYKMVPQ
ncbi:hypothetical protein J6590_011097 [Homalodisca vitripennis]|nr:hypothetical protein J6590_011097 [Homalodisca vitripennis]